MLKVNYLLLTFYSTNHYSSTKRLKSTYYIIKYSIYKKEGEERILLQRSQPLPKGMKG